MEAIGRGRVASVTAFTAGADEFGKEHIPLVAILKHMGEFIHRRILQALNADRIGVGEIEIGLIRRLGAEQAHRLVLSVPVIHEVAARSLVMHDMDVLDAIQVSRRRGQTPFLLKMGSIAGNCVAQAGTAVETSAIPHFKHAIFVEDIWVPRAVVIPITAGATGQNGIGGILDPMNAVARGGMADLDTGVISVRGAGVVATNAPRLVIYMKHLANLQ